MKLTPAMRTALEQAAKNPLRRVYDDQPGRPPWPAPAPSLHALVKRELVTVSEIRNKRGWRVTVWSITEAGKAALHPIRVGKDTVQSLHIRARGYTMLPVITEDGVIWDPQPTGEPEPVAPEKVQQLPSTVEARERWQRLKADMQREHELLPLDVRIRLAIESARAAGVDTREYEASILKRVRSLENRARRRAA